MENGAKAQSPFQVMTLIYMVYMIMSIDKSILAVLAEPLRHSFALNDRQLGLLNGMIYAVPFTIAVIPMGRLVDRTNRKIILTLMLAGWSLLTGLGALAQSFMALLIFRGAIGAAEAGGPPAMLSIITDTYDREHRPRAIGIFYTAAPVGVVVGALLVSWVAAVWGWRAAFACAGGPGILLAGALALWLREPLRGRFDVGSAHKEGSWRDAIAFIANHDRARMTIGAMTINAAGVFSVNYWITPLLMRSFGLGVGTAGPIALFGLGLAGALGSFTGGILVTRYFARRTDAQFLFYAAAMVASIPMPLLQFAAPSPVAMMIGFALFAFLNSLCFGPTFSLCLSYAPLAIRGTAAALVTLLTNLVGGLASLLVGILSDAFAGAGFKGSLGLAMAALGVFGMASAALYLRAAKSSGSFA